MKSLLLAFLLLAVVAARAEPPALADFLSELADGKPKTVVVYGTSLTKYGGWVTAMEQWFSEKFPGKVTVINSGGPGQHSGWGAAHVEDQVLVHRPNLVFLEFSYNDAHQRFKLAPGQCRANLDAIVDAILQQNPRAAIILQTMNVPWDNPKVGTGGTSASDRPRLEAFNENYRACARERNLPLVDNHPDWLRLWHTDEARFRAMVPDGLHPNKEGSLAVTWPNVRKLLESPQMQAKP